MNQAHAIRSTWTTLRVTQARPAHSERARSGSLRGARGHPTFEELQGRLRLLPARRTEMIQR